MKAYLISLSIFVVLITILMSFLVTNPRQVLYRKFGTHQVVKVYNKEEIIFNGKKQLQTEYLIQLPDSSLRYVIVVGDSIIANI